MNDYINGIKVSGGDAGDTTASANTVSLDSNGDAIITGHADDNDVYKFVASSSGSATIDLTGLSADIDLRLLNSSGSILDSSGAGGSSSESISYELTSGSTYYVDIDPYNSNTSDYHLSINAPSGSTTPVGDITAPSLVGITPITGSHVAVDSNIILTFSENIQKGVGDIIISNLSSGGERIISVSDSRVTVSNNTMTIDPGGDLSSGNMIDVQFGSGVILDNVGNSYTGLIGNNTISLERELSFVTDGGAVPVRLPFDSSHTHDVMQGMSSVFSHTGSLSWSVDFNFTYGQQVLSVASGVVVDMRERIPDGDSNSTDGSTTSGLATDIESNPANTSGIGNFVTIRQDNGTYASYMHFMQNSVTVEVGDSVIAGQVIGQTGNTGFRDGTHLHLGFGENTVQWQDAGGNEGPFGAVVADSSSSTSFPVYFIGIGNRVVTGADDGLVGNNTIHNIVAGTITSESLYGHEGDDTILGYGGNDALVGGIGHDTLTGGVGADSFIFDTAPSANNVDTITDFNVADDAIQLENAIFTRFTTTGALNVANFVVGATAIDANDYLIYNDTTGELLYDADGSGAGVSVEIAILGTNLNLSTADFIII